MNQRVLEALSALQGLPVWAWVAAAAILTFVIGWVMGRRRGVAVRPQGRPEIKVEAFRELQKNIARLESENATFSNFFPILRDFTKEINSRMERRAILAMLEKIAERLFAPTQILVFLMDEKVNMLTLVSKKGLSADEPATLQIHIGEGRIGWVAEHKVEMDVNDFIREMRHSGESQKIAAHFQFKTELCAPMVYEGKVLGVISVGGITRPSKHEKSMLRLIADVGSTALHNHSLFQKTQEMANCDGLTKLCNKRFFMERLSEEIVKAEKEHYPISLFMFDLDNFKHYNDTQGHQAGDEVLKITGELLRETVRPDDLPARYGGEEFIVLLPRSSKDGAMHAAERVRKRLADHPYPNRESQPLKVVSLSGGVSTFPDDGRTGAELIAAADAALYRAKRAGRNQVLSCETAYFSDDTEEPNVGMNNG
jgi:diguanylate cyclase (GGDEF)-like protein